MTTTIRETFTAVAPEGSWPAAFADIQTQIHLRLRALAVTTDLPGGARITEWRFHIRDAEGSWDSQSLTLTLVVTWVEEPPAVS